MMNNKKSIFKLIAVCVLVLSLSINTYATSTSEIDTSDSNKEGIEKKRDEAQSILDALEKDKSNLEVYVKELDNQLIVLQDDISRLIERQEELQADIAIKQDELVVAKDNEQTQYDAMKKRIQYIYENGDINYFDVVFKASSMSDIINSSEYISQLADYDYNMLTELITIRQDIALAELLLQEDLTQVDNLLTEQQEKETTMQDLITAKSNELSRYENSIGEQSELVQKYDKQLQAIEDELARLAALAAQQSGSSGPYTGGALLWPCPASSRITSQFDPNRVHPVLGYARPHRGIDIGVGVGNTVIAAAGGTVIKATYDGSAGNYVLIDHGGGLATIYMHNSQLLVSAGDVVTAGQTIALSGSTGLSTGPHLHFGVSLNGIYVNPMNYY